LRHADQDADIRLGTIAKSPERRPKYKDILGHDAPDTYNNNDDAKPWYLRPEHGAKDIWINPEGGVRGGTLPALIERLTMHDKRGLFRVFAVGVITDMLDLFTDMGFNSTFLVTFKSFTTLNELFDGLVQRFYIIPPENLNPSELKEWTEQKQVLARFRYVPTLGTQCQQYSLFLQCDQCTQTDGNRC
jgi:son of sevenless